MGRNKLYAALCAALLSGPVLGAGLQLYTEGSAEALGQAGAISGRDDLTSLAWYNPSALAGADRPALMVGSVFASIKTDYADGATDASMSEDWRVIPHLYYVQPLTDDVTATLSINAPYGLITEWSADWAGAPLAIYSDLEAVYLTPSVAWRPIDSFAASFGVNVVSATAELTRSAFPAPGEVKVKGDDMTYGYTFSARYQPFENWAVGGRYQSRVDLKITGALETGGVRLPASAELDLPSSFNIGVANTSIRNLSLGLDLVWTEWSVYDSLDIVAPPAPTTSSAKNWDDVISVRLGGEYALGESWALRAGYVWDQSPVPDATRSPELPGSDRQMLMFGFGWTCCGNVTLDAAYSYLWADSTAIGANPLGLTGEFETTTHLVGLSIGYDF